MYKATSSLLPVSTWNKLNKPHRGRFAPAPTGNLHLGSLVAAMASFLQAKSQNGHWLIRVEDLDMPRCVPGADQAIIKELARYGLISDEPIIHQSHPEQQSRYQAALDQLTALGLCYPCTCSRKDLRNHDRYPGTCLNRAFPCQTPHAIRIKTDDSDLQFEDLIQDKQCQNIAKQGGDFIIKRKDHLMAYQLAVVVDDAHQGITDVVRGFDILDTTGRQIHLQRLLGLATPQYAHFPVIASQSGHKLSKQNHAKEIYGEDPLHLTRLVLQLLGQNPPKYQQKTQSKLLDWAVENWDLNQVPKVNELLWRDAVMV